MNDNQQQENSGLVPIVLGAMGWTGILLGVADASYTFFTGDSFLDIRYGTAYGLDLLLMFGGSALSSVGKKKNTELEITPISDQEQQDLDQYPNVHSMMDYRYRDMSHRRHGNYDDAS